MKIILGLDLDKDYYYPLPPCGAREGEYVKGPIGFLDEVEKIYGIMPVQAKPAARAALYEKALHSANKTERFYTKSFALDPMGAARTLLDIRDKLHLCAGKKLNLAGTAWKSGRLKDIAAVEKAFLALEPLPGTAERIHHLMAEMDKSIIENPITEIAMVDALEDWEPLWSALLIKLGKMTKPDVLDAAKGKGDLGKAQESIRNNTKNKHDAEKDGTLVCVEAANLFEAADTAALLSMALAKDGRTVILSSGEETALCDAFARLDAAKVPAEQKGGSAAAIQFMTLFFESLWTPVDPALMQRFLLNKVNPLPWKVRTDLAFALSKTPAVGSEEWEKALQEAGKSLDAKEKTDVETWLLPITVKKDKKMPVKDVLGFCGRMKQWAASKTMGVQDRPDMVGLLTAAGNLEEALSALEVKELVQVEFQTLIRACTEDIPAQKVSVMETGGVPLISAASGMLASADNVIWWHANASAHKRSRPLFWNLGEMEELKSNREAPCMPVPPDRDTLRRAGAMRRLLLATGKKLIAMCAISTFGEPDQPHPSWHEFSAVFNRAAGNSDPLKITAKDAVQGAFGPWKKLVAGATGEETAGNNGRSYKPIWNLSKGDYKHLEEYSATRIEGALGCPFSFYLEKQAGIPNGYSYGISKEFTLKGEFSHAVLEEFLYEDLKRNWSGYKKAGEDLSKWFEKLLPEKAAIYDQPGMAQQRAGLKRTIIHAGETLAKILSDCDLEVVDVEQECEDRESGEIKLAGRVDVLLRKKGKNGQYCILDLKWGRSGRDELLEEGIAVQLAVYSRIIGKGKTWPATAFFIISKAWLFTNRPDVFPGMMPEGDDDEAKMWKKTQEEFNRILKELKKGNLEIGLPKEKRGKVLKTPALYPDNRPMMLNAKCDYCNYQEFCGVLDFETEETHG